jgi:hypothetical protein
VEGVVGQDGHGERRAGVERVREALFEVVFDLRCAVGFACAGIPGERDECHDVAAVKQKRCQRSCGSFWGLWSTFV